MDTVFRTKSEAGTDETPAIKASNQARNSVDSDIEPPYLDYERMKTKPYSVDYFELGDRWSDSMGGFPQEIATIEEYFKNKIESGDFANSISSVKQELKKIEKLTNIDKEERKVIKIGTIAEYVKFLMKTDDIKFNVKRYSARR